MEIKKSSVAQALYIKYCHQQSGYSLLDMYTQEDNHEQLALYHITESIKSNVFKYIGHLCLNCVKFTFIYNTSMLYRMPKKFLYQ